MFTASKEPDKSTESINATKETHLYKGKLFDIEMLTDASHHSDFVLLLNKSILIPVFPTRQ